MMLMVKGAADMTAVANGTGLTLANFTGITDVNADIGLLAGYLIASVPFLAGGVARGAMAISAQATSYLGPSQNAAEEAAREASTGNVALGNTSLENSTVLTRQFAQATVAPSFAYGAAQTRTVSDSGSTTTSFPEAAYDQVPNSSYPFTPTLGAEFSSRLSTMASEARSNSETYANVATQSTASAVAKFRELRQQLSNAHGSETAQGNSSSDSIQTAYSEVDQASASLQRQFGLSRRAADDMSISWFLNGEASAGLGGKFGPANIGVGAKGGRNQSWTDSDVGIASEDRSRIMGSLKQMSDSRNWSNARDSFLRTVNTSSNTSVSSRASGLNSSVTEAQSNSREARRAEEVAHRLESQASYFAGHSASGNLNLSQAYREWGLVEMDRNRDFYGQARFDDTAFQLSEKGQTLQAKFVESYASTVKAGVSEKLTPPAASTIARPAQGRVHRNSVPNRSGGHAPNTQPSDLHESVEAAQVDGRRKIAAQRDTLDGLTSDANGASSEAADRVKKWPE
jgi:conjugal transfer mating pair stabilization protein TraG